MATKSDFGEFAEQLQQEILDEIKSKYSETVVDHWMHPMNIGKLEDPDAYGRVTGPCGDTMEIFICVDNSTIIRCSFFTDGCGTTIACGSIITELARGKSIEEAKTITQEVILKTCGGLPVEDEHCALLASNTLMEAISLYEENRESGSTEEHLRL
jgi:nitrogen fixation NifU-like protein